MKWTWDGGFRANGVDENGNHQEKVFTSVAQARQFVEKENGGEALAKRVTKPQRPDPKRNGRPTVTLTAAQQKLKDTAMQRFKGI